MPRHCIRTNSKRGATFFWGALLFIGSVACSTDAPVNTNLGGQKSGGVRATGGGTASGGNVTGGTLGSTGGNVSGSGGSAITGGTKGTGGKPATGGNTTGGTTAATGGLVSGTGGNAIGGAVTGMGGTSNKGGAVATGGTNTTGGAATGGTTTGGAANGGKATGGKSTGGESTGGAATGGAGGVSGTGGAAPADCSKVAKVPLSFTKMDGYTSSEDFVFDLQGNYVGVDENDNLVRISKDKKKTLWVPKFGEAAGMIQLADGSVVVCSLKEGALKRVSASGAVSIILGGLLYPNGLELGPDGYAYVAENAGGRVRRVNVDKGDFTVVATGLQGPNGVAFSPDPNIFYVGSFEGSGVYKVVMPAPGELGKATVFARPNNSKLKDPVSPCPEQKENAACKVPGFVSKGKCQRLANVIDCVGEQDDEGGVTPGPGDANGGIDGLGVDLCGNVYASEFTYGYLWRISPSGTIEKAATLPSSWVPNMKWGRGLGGFESNVLYVADRDGSALFAVSVGIGGASTRIGVK